jgi:CBS domain-containing protein
MKLRDQRKLNMKIKEIMTKSVETIAPDMPIQEAADRMRSLDVGVLPVSKGDRLVGMLTDRDLTIRAVAQGKDPKTTPVQEAMTVDFVYCFEDQETEEAERIMEKNQIRRLPVLSDSKLLVGIVSLGDLATKTDERRAGETLQKVSQPSR